MTDLKNKILSLVKADLDDIENAIRDNLNTYLDLVSKVAGHILFAGGKRLRPLLLILSARICGYNGTYDKTFSTIFEYLHAATLLHDDLVDGATLRRGKPVANLIWGNSMAILVGDFLLSRAISITSGSNRLKIIEVIAEIAENMSQGELHQLIQKENLDLSEKEYMEIIYQKTAALMQGACRSGAILADASEEKETALSNYGMNLGMAFQIVDDLLDYTADKNTLGKESGADLKEGKSTLPVIYALKNADSKDRLLMEEILKSTNFNVQDFTTFTKLLVKYGGIDYSEKIAAEYISKAVDAMSVFGPSKSKELFLLLADYTLARKE